MGVDWCRNQRRYVPGALDYLMGLLSLPSKANTDGMKATGIQDLFNSFESIAIEYEGVECWSARELYTLLG